MSTINARIAAELSVKAEQVEAAVALLDEGSTVPFIARYRKEVTGGLDDTQLRKLEERLRLPARAGRAPRHSPRQSIDEQGKLTPELARAIQARRQARPAGRPVPALQAEAPHQGADRPRSRAGAAGRRAARRSRLLTRTAKPPKFINAEKGVADVKAALDGARHILMERFAEGAALLGDLRECLWATGVITSKVAQGKEERRREVPRLLRISRADATDAVAPRAGAVARPQRRHARPRCSTRRTKTARPHPCEGQDHGRHSASRNAGRPADKWLVEVVRWTWKVKLHASA